LGTQLFGLQFQCLGNARHRSRRRLGAKLLDLLQERLVLRLPEISALLKNPTSTRRGLHPKQGTPSHDRNSARDSPNCARPLILEESRVFISPRLRCIIYTAGVDQAVARCRRLFHRHRAASNPTT
jgi:hypothetical protein